MNKLVLLMIAAVLTVAISSCSNYSTVEFPDGQRVEVRNPLYHKGDTVCIYEGGFSNSISETFWKDTAYCNFMPDSTFYCASFRMGVIIDE